jgi:hypothetical protein
MLVEAVKGAGCSLMDAQQEMEHCHKTPVPGESMTPPIWADRLVVITVIVIIILVSM